MTRDELLQELIVDAEDSVEEERQLAYEVVVENMYKGHTTIKGIRHDHKNKKIVLEV
jgi:hypothetical protein